MEHRLNVSESLWTSPALIVGGVTVTTAELLVFIAGVALAAVLAWRAARLHEKAQAAAPMGEALGTLSEAQAALGARLEAMLEGAVKGQTHLRDALDARLDAVSKRLGDGLSETERRTHENLKMLHERLALIDRAQKNIETLSGEVSGLQALLSNKQKRGAFGELQMQDLVKTFLPPNAYDFQYTLSNGARVDGLIRLPDPPGSVAVDAKFPMESWRAYAEADDAAIRDAAARRLRADVLKHIKDIAEKYLLPGETADTALLFLPSEAVYATLHAEFSDVVDRGFRSRVMIVSPTTFMATLHTMRAVMRDAAMREQTHVIQREVALLGEDVVRLDERVGKLQRHFDQAQDDVRQIRISTEKVSQRAERIAAVDVEPGVGADLPAPVVPSPKRLERAD